MASKILEFQKKLLSDAATRKAFAENPSKVLGELGVSLPPNTKLPHSIPLKEIEEQVRHVQAALDEQKIDLSEVPVGDPPAVTRFIEEAIPLRTSDLRLARNVHDAFVSAARIPGGPGDAATVAVVGAVVAAVVAVPVAVFGKTAKDFERFVNPAAGIESISRIGGSFVLHGPAGVRVEGLDAAGVVNVIKGLR